jgi:prevent-host-death family protein
MKQEGGHMQIFKASEFKAKCLKLMNDVQTSGEEIIITKNGKPISKLVPYRIKASTLLGMHKSKVSSGDSEIFSTGVNWETDQ